MKTKFDLKILLLVSILLIAMCLFNTNMVQAANVTTETKITESTETKTTTTEKTQSTTITDPKEILKLVPDTITIDIKESEVDLEFSDTNTTFIKIQEAIKKQLANKNCDLSTLCVMFEVTDEDFIDIHSAYANIGMLGFEESKIIKVNYSNTAQYNKTDESYVKNKLESIKFSKYEGIDAVFTIYNIGDEENANKWTFDTFDFDKLLNDNSIMIKKIESYGGQGGGTPWGTGAALYFYKNDILYATKFVLNYGAYGTTLENGTPVNMAKLEKDDEVYKEMAKELEKNGFKNIIGCYELEAYGTTNKNMKVSFNIGSNYNGKEVQILHKKNDNTYETFKATVVDGKATITVNEFSPFMIALTNANTSTNTNTNTNTSTSKEDNNKVLDNEPKTGVADYTILTSIIALISLGGIVTLKFKK